MCICVCVLSFSFFLFDNCVVPSYFLHLYVILKKKKKKKKKTRFKRTRRLFCLSAVKHLLDTPLLTQ